eukprot:GHVR01104957.1.p1 GENE.GHVR01104957.1~~GHVR01104957.1.p1  ORF type:complete len:246 (+),score=22.26 GHVR01104957.1:227-964(+)
MRRFLLRFLSHLLFISGDDTITNPLPIVYDQESGENQVLLFAKKRNGAMKYIFTQDGELNMINSLLGSEIGFGFDKYFLSLYHEAPYPTGTFYQTFETFKTNIKDYYINYYKNNNINLYGSSTYCFMLSLWYDKSAILLWGPIVLHFKLDENKMHVRIRVFNTNTYSIQRADDVLETLPFLEFDKVDVVDVVNSPVILRMIQNIMEDTNNSFFVRIFFGPVGEVYGEFRSYAVKVRGLFCLLGWK